MFLVRLPDGHPVTWLFLHADPCHEGCPYPSTADVKFEDDLSMIGGEHNPTIFDWAVVGRSKSRPDRYRRFLCRIDVEEARYESLPGAAVELVCWRDFLTHFPAPRPPGTA